MTVTELIEKYSGESEIKQRLDGAIEAYHLLAGWHGAECECGHSACKKCRDTKKARGFIRKAKEPLPPSNVKQFSIELLEQIMAKANGNSDAAKPDVVYVEIEEALEKLRK